MTMVPIDSNVPAPAERPFQWGQGGRRLTPEQIAIERRLAEQQRAAGADYSPVGHWTQGLARVANALVGGLRERAVDRASAANAAESDAVLKALTNPPAASEGGATTITGAPNPNAPVIDPTVKAPANSSPPSDSGSTVVATTPVASDISPVATALMNPPPPRATRAPRAEIIAALTNPYVSAQVRDVAGKLWEQEYQASKPQYFNSGRDRVAYDPTTGNAEVLYDGTEDFQEYADQLGLEPGTEEYNEAMQDFVLRGQGPTAQAGRATLEGLRQQNRLTLRQTPTFAQTHPSTRPVLTPRTTGNVFAPILAKMGRGEKLTPDEDRVMSFYGRGTRSGKKPSSATGPIATDDKGNKVQYNGTAWVPIK